jgi:hypothetical protein
MPEMRMKIHAYSSSPLSGLGFPAPLIAIPPYFTIKLNIQTAAGMNKTMKEIPTAYVILR